MFEICSFEWYILLFTVFAFAVALVCTSNEKDC